MIFRRLQKEAIQTIFLLVIEGIMLISVRSTAIINSIKRLIQLLRMSRFWTAMHLRACQKVKNIVISPMMAQILSLSLRSWPATILFSWKIKLDAMPRKLSRAWIKTLLKSAMLKQDIPLISNFAWTFSQTWKLIPKKKLSMMQDMHVFQTSILSMIKLNRLQQSMELRAYQSLRTESIVSYFISVIRLLNTIAFLILLL